MIKFITFAELLSLDRIDQICNGVESDVMWDRYIPQDCVAESKQSSVKGPKLSLNKNRMLFPFIGLRSFTFCTFIVCFSSFIPFIFVLILERKLICKLPFKFESSFIRVRQLNKFLRHIGRERGLVYLIPFHLFTSVQMKFCLFPSTLIYFDFILSYL